jgi:ubiquinone/menaquinone biosynthesis C-methylase UbiE/membrane-associated phospholipid phosphatase
MIDDSPKALLVLLGSVLALGRLWIAVGPPLWRPTIVQECWTRGRRLAVIALTLIAFVAVAEDVVFEEHDELVLRVDHLVTAALASWSVHVRPFALTVRHLTGAGVGLLVGVVVIALLVAGRRADGFMTLVGMVTAWGLAIGVDAGLSLLHPRPLPEGQWLGGLGFPSQPVMVTLVALGMIAWALGRDRRRLIQFALGAGVLTIAVVAGASRIILYAHWPSDVLGGLMLGSVWLAVVIGVTQSLERGTLSAPTGHQRPVAVEYQATHIAETYDRVRFHSIRGRYNNWRLSRLVARVVRRLPPGSLVLDVPCGTGRIDQWLLGVSLRVIAVDVSHAMLSIARRRVRPAANWLGLLQADADDLPLRTGSVDGVFMIRFVHLLDRLERRRALREAARVSNGWVVVEYRNHEKPLGTAKRVLTGWVTGTDRPRTKSSLAEVKDELRECGLAAERCYFPSRLFSGSVVVLARRQPPGGAGRSTQSLRSLLGALAVGRYWWVAVALLAPVCAAALAIARGHGELKIYTRASARLLAGEEIYRAVDYKQFSYPPFFALPAMPLLALPEILQAPAWYLVSLLAMVAGVVVVMRQIWPMLGAPGERVGPSHIIFIALLALLSWVHLTASIEYGSHDLLLFFLLALGMSAWAAGTPVWAGIFLGLGAAAKATPLLFLPVFLWRREFRAAGVLAATATAATLAEDVLFPRRDGSLWVAVWYRMFVSPLEVGGPAHVNGVWWPSNHLNQSLSATLYRLFTEIPGYARKVPDVSLLNPGPTAVHAVILIGQLAVLGLLARVTRRCRHPTGPPEERAFQLLGVAGAVCAAMLLLSPMTGRQHFAILFVPLAVCLADFLRQARAALVGIFLAMILLLGLMTAKDVVGRATADQFLAHGSLTACALLALLATAWVLHARRRRA